jgi:hypothetical protein
MLNDTALASKACVSNFNFYCDFRKQVLFFNHSWRNSSINEGISPKLKSAKYEINDIT